MERPTYTDLPDISLADLFDAYVKGAEHMDGESFWDNFKTVDEFLGDFYLHQGWISPQEIEDGLREIKEQA